MTVHVLSLALRGSWIVDRTLWIVDCGLWTVDKIGLPGNHTNGCNIPVAACLVALMISQLLPRLEVCCPRINFLLLYRYMNVKHHPYDDMLWSMVYNTSISELSQ